MREALRAAPAAFLAAFPVAVAADLALGGTHSFVVLALTSAAGAILVSLAFGIPRRLPAIGGGIAIAAAPLALLGPSEAALVRMLVGVACVVVVWDVTRR